MFLLFLVSILIQNNLEWLITIYFEFINIIFTKFSNLRMTFHFCKGYVKGNGMHRNSLQDKIVNTCYYMVPYNNDNFPHFYGNVFLFQHGNKNKNYLRASHQIPPEFALKCVEKFSRDKRIPQENNNIWMLTTIVVHVLILIL